MAASSDLCAAMGAGLDLQHVDCVYRYRKHFGHLVRVDNASPAHRHQLLRHEFGRGRLARGTVRDATRRRCVPLR